MYLLQYSLFPFPPLSSIFFCLSLLSTLLSYPLHISSFSLPPFFSLSSNQAEVAERAINIGNPDVFEGQKEPIGELRRFLKEKMRNFGRNTPIISTIHPSFAKLNKKMQGQHAMGSFIFCTMCSTVLSTDIDGGNWIRFVRPREGMVTWGPMSECSERKLKKSKVNQVES